MSDEKVWHGDSDDHGEPPSLSETITTYPALSTSERWWRHLVDCEVCCIADSLEDAYLDRVCAIGSELRGASIRAWLASGPRGDTAAFGRRGDSRGSGPIQGAA